MNNSLRSEIAVFLCERFGNDAKPDWFLNEAGKILSLIESKLPEKKKPSDKDFSLDEGINPTYDEDGDLVDFGRPPQKHKMNRPYNDGWNAYHDEVKSILRGSDDLQNPST